MLAQDLITDVSIKSYLSNTLLISSWIQGYIEESAVKRSPPRLVSRQAPLKPGAIFGTCRVNDQEQDPVLVTTEHVDYTRSHAGGPPPEGAIDEAASMLYQQIRTQEYIQNMRRAEGHSDLGDRTARFSWVITLQEGFVPVDNRLTGQLRETLLVIIHEALEGIIEDNGDGVSIYILDGELRRILVLDIKTTPMSMVPPE